MTKQPLLNVDRRVLAYWPLARFAWAAEKLGIDVRLFSLEMYLNSALYVMRTDAYNRLCTQLEKRFIRAQTADVLTRAGFGEIIFSERVPYWCAVGIGL